MALNRMLKCMSHVARQQEGVEKRLCSQARVSFLEAGQCPEESASGSLGAPRPAAADSPAPLWRGGPAPGAAATHRAVCSTGGTSPPASRWLPAAAARAGRPPVPGTRRCRRRRRTSLCRAGGGLPRLPATASGRPSRKPLDPTVTFKGLLRRDLGSFTRAIACRENEQ